MSYMIDYCFEKAKQIPINGNNQRVYAVITDKKGKVLSESANNYVKTHPFQFQCAKKVDKEKKCFLHAEIAAICKLTYNNKNKAYKIYIARSGKKDIPLLAAPCEVCQEALNHTCIEEIEYTQTNNDSMIVYRNI